MEELKVIFLYLIIIGYFVATSILAYGWLAVFAILGMLFVHYTFEETIEDYEESNIDNKTEQ